MIGNILEGYAVDTTETISISPKIHVPMWYILFLPLTALFYVLQGQSIYNVGTWILEDHQGP